MTTDKSPLFIPTKSSDYEKSLKYVFLGLNVSPSGFTVGKHSLLEFACYVAEEDGTIYEDGFEATIDESETLDLVVYFDEDKLLDKVKSCGKKPEVEIIRFVAWLDEICDSCEVDGRELILLCDQTHFAIQWINCYIQKYTNRAIFGVHPMGADSDGEKKTVSGYDEYFDIAHVWDPDSIYAGACLLLFGSTSKTPICAREKLGITEDYKNRPALVDAELMVKNFVEFRKKCLSGYFLNKLFLNKLFEINFKQVKTDDDDQKNKRKKE